MAELSDYNNGNNINPVLMIIAIITSKIPQNSYEICFAECLLVPLSVIARR